MTPDDEREDDRVTLLDEPDEAGCPDHWPDKVRGCRACEEADE